VADQDARAQLFQPLGIGATPWRPSPEPIADLEHDLGDAAHADAAYAHEMDGAEVERNGAQALDHRGVINVAACECTRSRV
jgi:CubicO group peptidase (beta-lactamase class C family)